MSEFNNGRVNAAPTKSVGFFNSLLKWPGASGGEQQQPQGQTQGQQQKPNNGIGSSMQPGGYQGPNQQPQSQQPQGQDPNQSQSSPLDSFKDLWQTDPNQQQNADPFASPLFNTDPAKIVEAAGQQDFLRNINPELRDKALSGDAQSMMQIINNAVQQSLALSLQLQTATVEQAGKQLGSRFNQSLPAQFKKLALGAQKPTNPIMDHPAMKPVVDTMRDKFASKYPEKRPEEIHAMLEQYFSEIGSAFAPGQQGGSSGENSRTDGFDFENWG